MAIKKSFSGALLRKPGAYSSTKVDQSGGAPLGGNGILFIVGESDTGAPGDQEGYKRFSSAQLPDLIAEYGSGPIVDVAKAALSPSKTPGVNGPDEFVVWKTNSSVQASLILQNSSPANLLNLKDRNWGLPGNTISVQVSNGTTPSLQRQITVRKNTTTEILSQNAGQAQLVIQYVGAGSAASLTISGASESAKVLTTSITGAALDNLTIALKDFKIKELVDYINSFGGGSKYTCTLSNTQSGSVTPGTDLDPVSSLNILSPAQSLYRLQHELLDIINNESKLIQAELATTPVAGLPVVLAQTLLSGGVRGASLQSDFSDGFDKSLSEDWNVCVPAVSQDAAQDITAGLTDPSSTYDIESVHAALDSHLRLRGNVKNRREAMGMVGYRKNTKAVGYTQAQNLSSELIQMAIQDVLVVGLDGNLSWKQPHIFAALCAGSRCGTPVGEPLTHKFLNCSGIGHFVNSVTGISAGDFVPETDYDPAIDAGVLFAEKASGGFRIVVDNTTYGKDQSFVFNRGSVVEAAQYIAKTLRETAELVFVGKKISGGTAQSIKSVLGSKLLELRDAQIITPTDAYPLGYDDKNFVVQINGNAATVQLFVIPVQGLDFVLIEFTLGNIVQSA